MPIYHPKSFVFNMFTTPRKSILRNSLKTKDLLIYHFPHTPYGKNPDLLPSRPPAVRGRCVEEQAGDNPSGKMEIPFEN